MHKDSVKQPPNPVIKLNRRRDRRQKGEKEGKLKKSKRRKQKGQFYHRLQRAAGNFRIQTHTHTQMQGRPMDSQNRFQFTTSLHWLCGLGYPHLSLSSFTWDHCNHCLTSGLLGGL